MKTWNEAKTPAANTAGDQSCVVIIDDDCDIRTLIGDLLQNAGFRARVFSGAFEFLAAHQGLVPSCILLDVRLHGMSGLDLQDRLNQMGSRAPIVFMTGFADVSMTIRAMKSGAFDFLEKPFREQEILDAVFRADHAYQQRAEVARAAAMIEARFDSLTTREREVLKGVVAGLLNKQIAGELGISEITVKVHRANLMRKMEVRTLAELVRQASLHAVLDAPDSDGSQGGNIAPQNSPPVGSFERKQAAARLFA
ncbi:response regulator transcription factor [Rhizobium johnstonii]|uniref:response regulator transcription factor n=1 Tax=Rhizobium TaxID=379 RepID=UPI00140FDE19|nr:response regulator [Rhizobium leguminosarum]QIO64016.1 response regulator transcription factor [Rhizobium leguminosarum bv. trifolii]